MESVCFPNPTLPYLSLRLGLGHNEPGITMRGGRTGLRHQAGPHPVYRGSAAMEPPQRACVRRGRCAAEGGLGGGELCAAQNDDGEILVVGCMAQLYEPCVSLAMEMRTLAPLLRQAGNAPEHAAPEGPQNPTQSASAATAAASTSTASVAAKQASPGGSGAVFKDDRAERQQVRCRPVLPTHCAHPRVDLLIWRVVCAFGPNPNKCAHRRPGGELPLAVAAVGAGVGVA